MRKQYAVHYTYKSAGGIAIRKAKVVNTLEDVRKTKREIRDAGYGFLGVRWRERIPHRDLSEGWQEF